ncbi:hypothetical protein MED01_002461 [Micromonospora sp. MED01]|uniref:hypothetical protein n=1 Tax=Micromonospora alfalfae TaxID=2911212 RepID=UPI001EE85847|nr:hypothetical protein [Micromonospora alfalfae]MCG5464295.1 hypothetical protein [Micromonospora alfalfae]
MTDKFPADLNPGDRIHTGTQKLTVDTITPGNVPLGPDAPGWVRREVLRHNASTATTASTVMTVEGYRLTVADDYPVPLIHPSDDRPLGTPEQAIRTLFARM